MSHTPAAKPEIPAARYRDRLDRLAGLVEDRGFEAVLVGVGPDLEYLTGYRALPLERLTMLVVARGADAFLVVPRLERPAAEAGLSLPVPIRTWEETEDPYALALSGIVAARDGEVRFAVSDGLWASHLLAFQAHLAADDRFDAYAFGLASSLLGQLRAIKDPDEIALLRLGAHAADRVVEAIAAGPLLGRTEADVAREVRERLIAEGHDEASFAIVASAARLPPILPFTSCRPLTVSGSKSAKRPEALTWAVSPVTAASNVIVGRRPPNRVLSVSAPFAESSRSAGRVP